MKRANVSEEDIESVPKKVQKIEENEETSMDFSFVVHHDKMSNSLDLTELMNEIQKSNNLLKSHACTKLKVIVDQMIHLRHEAELILRKIKIDQFMHNVSCNFVKRPGHIYHLYQRPCGENYLSMLSPDEWGKSAPKQQYKGAYRLEEDYSWNHLEKTQKLDSLKKPISSFLDEYMQLDDKKTVKLFK